MSYANHAGKPIDIAVFGASGFTGRLVAEYLAERHPPDGAITWAMVGRSADKLAAVRDEIGAPAETPLLIADAADPASLKAVAAQAKVVLTTVGPYQLYGEPLVKICAETGTDYVDLCGEPAWMRQMIDAYEGAAKASGARIVFSCGFDSIPFDLGVFYLQEQAKARLGAPLGTIDCRVRQMKGGFSGGTAASLGATMAAAAKDPSILALLKSPFALAPGFEGPKQDPGAKPRYDEALGSWLTSFIMAPINTKNVHRSNFLAGHPYGADFQYSEMMMTGPGAEGEAAAAHVAASNPLAAKDAPKPGEGPSKEERESGLYDILFLGSGAAGSLTACVKGDKDPGYGSTSKMISEAALCLVDAPLATSGGIWTPAPALGAALIERLEANAGLSFTLE